MLLNRDSTGRHMGDPFTMKKLKKAVNHLHLLIGSAILQYTSCTLKCHENPSSPVFCKLTLLMSLRFRLTRHFIRYTLLVLGYTSFCPNCLWHRFNTGSFLRDFVIFNCTSTFRLSMLAPGNVFPIF